MPGIKGITVTLYKETEGEPDAFGRPTYTEEAISVDNVLVAPASTSETLDTVNLTGKKAVYTLGIPKGDSHDWKDKKVEFFGETFRTFGEPLKGIDDMIPLEWNMKIQVERYD
jgi:hypothetical protein